MSTTITYTGGSITPTLVDGFASERASQNVVHVILGRADPDVSLRVPVLRTGTLRMMFSSGAAAEAAEVAHALLRTFTLTSTDEPVVNMNYVVAGAVTLELDDETRALWTLEVEYQEVP